MTLKRESTVIRDSFNIEWETIQLSFDAERSLDIENAGGNSARSEALSIHYFNTVHNATDFMLEMEVPYWIDYKMVDFICTIDSERCGVSVTRAMKYRDPDGYTFKDGHELLYKKLYGLIVARKGVEKRARFYKSILHIWCQTENIAKILTEVYKTIDISSYGLDIKGSLTLLLTVYNDESIYSLDRG